MNFFLHWGIQWHTFTSSTIWELLNHGLNLWLTTWGKHRVSHRSTGEGNSSVWPEGVEPGSTSPRPHLKADCHWGRISSWRLLLLESLQAYTTGELLSFVSFSMLLCKRDNLSGPIPVYLFTLQSEYLLAIDPQNLKRPKLKHRHQRQCKENQSLLCKARGEFSLWR